MPMSCVAYGCSSRDSPSRTVRFFRFPSVKRDRQRREAWIRAVKRQDAQGRPWQPSAASRLCGKHFVTDIRTSYRRCSCIQTSSERRTRSTAMFVPRRVPRGKQALHQQQVQRFQVKEELVKVTVMGNQTRPVFRVQTLHSTRKEQLMHSCCLQHPQCSLSHRRS
ncbi:uncharacterized protein [Dermacentor albipictus]|uniref:uncharacterized protein isoform X2 n=1 Tax=Dermacentor albipictus TaxID=60249 RepID=UPI0038FD3203